MRDKEKLLSFKSKLKFIFAHFALKEGGDNPNVFQICTLNETASVIKKRQQIGRGLRISVNQDGERVHGFEVNTLTVIANESYEDFISELLKDRSKRKKAYNSAWWKIPVCQYRDRNRRPPTRVFGSGHLRENMRHLFDAHYIDMSGKVQDKLRADIKENKVDLPEELKSYAGQIVASLKKVNLNIKNAGDQKPVDLNKVV